MATAIPKNRILPPKDASNFRAALKLYESKQYKKALKGVEGVLKKSPEHGESLALKGLLLYHLGKKEEGHDSIKKGLAKDLTSYVCWHIHGLYHRQEKNYEEATKCYTKALQFDPENQNVLRDLAVLQMHVKHYDALIATRKKMLTDKPGFRQNWTSLAIAQHLSGDYAGAEKTLSNFEQLLKEPIPQSDLENSELKLYKNSIIYESGNVEKALNDLELIADKVLDVKRVAEFRSKYLLELGRNKEAEKEYRLLIKRNPECKEYYAGLEKSLGIDESNIELRSLLYARLAEKYPKADLPRSIPLDFLPTGIEFRIAVSSYIKNLLSRGVPSAFVMIKPLYRNGLKRDIIDKFIVEYSESQETASKLNGSASNGESEKEEKQPESKSSELVVWTLYFLAQHYSHLGKNTLALETIDKAIALSPSDVLLELRMTEAQILKRSGDIEGAAKTMSQARELDLQDRFINTKAAKYLLRANKIDDAVATISLFTKNDSNGKGVQDMHDMQGLWFLTEQGEAYARLGNDGMALKRFHAIFKIYEDAKNDQFDFHFYCPRRGTILAYMNMLSWANEVNTGAWYLRAAVGAVNIYLKLAVKRARLAAGVSPEDCDDEYEGLDEAEKKKAMKKAKKERAKEIKKEHEEKEKSDSNDPDMFGKLLLATTTPLDEAYNIWKPLSKQAADSYRTWQLGFEIYLAQQKYILALQALSKAKNAADVGNYDTAAVSSWIRAAAVKARYALESDSNAPAALRLVQNKTLPTIVDEGNIVEDNLNDYSDNHIVNSANSSSASSAAAILNWASTKIFINRGVNPIKVSVEKKLLEIPQLPGASLEDVVRGYELLKTWRSPALADYRVRALTVWPKASVLSE